MIRFFLTGLRPAKALPVFSTCNWSKAYGFIIGLLILASCGKKSDFGFLSDPTKNDNGLDSASLKADTSLKIIDKSKYLQASIFPGLVCVQEPRVTQTIDLGLFYVKSEDLRISVLPKPQFSTGFYAAPGELVVVTVPEGVYDLSMQIGAWTDNVEHIANAQRDPVIYSQVKLVPGKNYASNLYGGHIYILPSSPRSAPVQLTFQNVVESPDFVLGKTDPVAWKQKLMVSCVPYLELRSKYVIFTIRRDYAVRFPVTDPVQLMTEWDEGIKNDFYGWTGLEENPSEAYDRSPQLPYRIVLDVDISVGYGHSGFPIMAINDTYWQTTITNLEALRKSAVWGLYHEIGHNFQQGKHWSWSALGETTNNLFIYHLAKRMSKAGLGQWPANHDPDGAPGNPELIASKMLAFAAAENPAKDFDNFTDPELEDKAPFARLLPFLQMFDKIPANWGYPGQGDGWGIMTELYKRSRRAIRESSTTLSKHDFVYETVSDYTRKDWRMFFQKWGIALSSTAMARVEAKGYPEMNQEIWKYNPYTRTGGDGVWSPADPYANTSWAVVSYSSQESVGEGPPNGLAASAIDGNLNTFWHTEWQNASPVPPHHIVIDLGAALGKSLSFSGFKYAHRNNLQTRAIRVHIEVSNDNASWTTLSGSPFSLANVSGFQTFNLPATVTARYIRLKILSTGDLNGGAVYWAFSEFAVLK